MSNDVAMGRRINHAEKFKSAVPWRAPNSGSRGDRRIRRLDANRSIRLEPELPSGHDGISGRYTVPDDGLIPFDGDDRDRVHFRDIPRRDHVDVGTFATGLYRCGRHDNRVRQGLERNAHRDKLAWPEFITGIREYGFAADCPGRCVDLVVDQDQLALPPSLPSLFIENADGYRSAKLRRPQLRQTVLGDRKSDRDGTLLGYHDQSGRVGGMHDVTCVDQAR